MGPGDFLALAAGAGNTIALSLLAIAIGTPLGLGLALIRWGRVPGLDGAVATVVSLLRATPAVTLALLVYFALPTVGLEVPRFVAGVATLTLGSMAYIAKSGARPCSPFRSTNSMRRAHSACPAGCAYA
jgi:His/Glu/Gln/Arg/opine family amino acid ABC transporter permease subunit